MYVKSEAVVVISCYSISLLFVWTRNIYVSIIILHIFELNKWHLFIFFCESIIHITMKQKSLLNHDTKNKLLNVCTKLCNNKKSMWYGAHSVCTNGCTYISYFANNFTEKDKWVCFFYHVMTFIFLFLWGIHVKYVSFLWQFKYFSTSLSTD